MAGLVPAIYVTVKKDVDARDEPGHDVGRFARRSFKLTP